MNGRILALGGALTLVLLLGALTIDVMIRTGVDALVLISLAIVGMVGFGVVGALFNPPGK
ncbi:MAG TPA: hypothetical protein VHF90_10695 [Thermoleophilaceae bacterium]|nr:hypothetical protein [Thermoleophilaceae bacterium]